MKISNFIKTGIALSLAFTTILSAQELRARNENANLTIKIRGNGAYVCKAQGMPTDRPVVARGTTERMAKREAMHLCKERDAKNDGFFCEIKDCETDTQAQPYAEVLFMIETANGYFSIESKNGSKYRCRTEAFSEKYVVKAPTRIEGEVLATNVCADNRQGDAFFCNDVKCKELPKRDQQIQIKLPGIRINRPGLN